MMVRCRYARNIAIIYALNGGDMSQGAIDAISIEDFYATYQTFPSMIYRPHQIREWYSMYAFYVNACAHIRTTNHQCSADCIVAKTPYQSRGRDPELRQLISEHMSVYSHPRAMPMGAYGRAVGRPTERTFGAFAAGRGQAPPRTHDQSPQFKIAEDETRDVVHSVQRPPPRDPSDEHSRKPRGHRGGRAHRTEPVLTEVKP
jgi:hypothetical protein